MSEWMILPIDGAARKIQPPDTSGSVTLTPVADVNTGFSVRLMIGASVSIKLVQVGPRITTGFDEASLLKALTEPPGCVRASSIRSLILAPLLPPAALASLTARSAP